MLGQLLLGWLCRLLGRLVLGSLPDDIAEKALNINPQEDLKAPMLGLLIGVPRGSEDDIA